MKSFRVAGFIFLSLLLISPAKRGHADTGNSQERAAAALEEDLKTDPHNAELWVHLGFAYRKVNKIEQAQSAFEKAVSLNPKTTEAWYMLGLIDESKHDMKSAEKAWQNYLAVEQDPDKRSVAEKHLHHVTQ